MGMTDSRINYALQRQIHKNNDEERTHMAHPSTPYVLMLILEAGR